MPVMSKNLDQIVLQLLNARRGDWQAVSDASGVSYSWLSKFLNGHIDNPGYATLTKLHDCLTKTEAPTKHTPKAIKTVEEGV